MKIKWKFRWEVKFKDRRFETHSHGYNSKYCKPDWISWRKRVGQKNKPGKCSHPETGRQEKTELRQLLPQRAVLAVFYYHAKILSTLV